MTPENTPVLGLGTELIQRVWFGDDTVTIRMRNHQKYEDLIAAGAGQQIVFRNDPKKTQPSFQIDSQVNRIEEITLGDVLGLDPEDVKKAGADAAVDLYDSQFYWYGDEVDDDTQFVLIEYQEPEIAPTLRDVRTSIGKIMLSIPGMEHLTADFQYYPYRYNQGVVLEVSDDYASLRKPGGGLYDVDGVAIFEGELFDGETFGFKLYGVGDHISLESLKLYVAQFAGDRFYMHRQDDGTIEVSIQDKPENILARLQDLPANNASVGFQRGIAYRNDGAGIRTFDAAP